MERDILKQLKAWQYSAYRKPLVLNGARQVGKTWVLKEFGHTCFSNCAYISLEEIAPGIPSEYASLFETTRDTKRLLQNLSLATNTNIVPGETLIILDEIQDCPAAVGALKAFCETASEYHIACAGSLLGVKLARDTSAFPVGKVDFLTMYPLTFSEYLRAVGLGNVDDYLLSLDKVQEIPALFNNQLTEELAHYFITGGMPEVVYRWSQQKDITLVDKTLTDLLDSYERDFAKHGGKSQFEKISRIWNSLPAQLARENKKFMWRLAREGARAREYEDALEWLVGAGLVTQIHANSAHGVPLSAYDDPHAFKAYLLDVGMLRSLARLDAKVFLEKDSLFTEFKGAFVENYVLQELVPQLEVLPRYWTNEKPRYEVDFIVQCGSTIIPVEVKAGQAVRSASLRYYAEKHKRSMVLKVRFSMKDFSLDGNTLNIPLYLAHRAIPIIQAVLGSMAASKI